MRLLGNILVQLSRNLRHGSVLSGETLFSVPSETITEDDDVIDPLGFNLLSKPTSPLIDFVFVHGLGGGSRKTWSKTPSDAHFWPKRWLPIDPDFENIRIWSLGCDSIYKEEERCPEY
jgi:hypothetical protein